MGAIGNTESDYRVVRRANKAEGQSHECSLKVVGPPSSTVMESGLHLPGPC